MCSHGFRTGRQKWGTSSRLLRALLDYMTKWKIEIIPRYVRSGRNFPCDHLSRTDEQGIAIWARNMGTTSVDFPGAWFELVDSWKPEAEFLDLERFDKQRTLRSRGRTLVGCEWRPSGYGFVAAVAKCGGVCYLHGPSHDRIQQRMQSCPEWNGEVIDIMCGMVWTEFELSDFADSAQLINPKYALAIAPFAFCGPPNREFSWSETIVVDSSRFSCVVNRRWRIYFWGDLRGGTRDFNI